MADGYFLYRIFTAGDRLLYVGATTNPAMRFYNHQRGRSWWTEVDRITITHYSSFAELRAAESDAIRDENPEHNVEGTMKPRPWTQKKRRRRGEGSIFRRADGYWVAGISAHKPGEPAKRNHRFVSNNRQTVERKLAELKAECLTDGK